MLKQITIYLIAPLALLQLIQLDHTNPKIDPDIELKAPAPVMKLLKNSCYDCHSNETKWPSYSYIAPISFGVVSHVNDGRKAMNFSEWKNIKDEQKIKRLKRAIETVKNGRMALPSYLDVHESAKLSKDNKKVLTTWFEKELKILEAN
ncbi:MAG: cytochrome C [Helicobacteraceae bacterium]|nr:cytochrome C [Helicobacteraceae bacterium]